MKLKLQWIAIPEILWSGRDCWIVNRGFWHAYWPVSYSTYSIQQASMPVFFAKED
jgi:hypothetical protein